MQGSFPLCRITSVNALMWTSAFVLQGFHGARLAVLPLPPIGAPPRASASVDALPVRVLHQQWRPMIPQPLCKATAMTSPTPSPPAPPCCAVCIQRNIRPLLHVRAHPWDYRKHVGVYMGMHHVLLTKFRSRAGRSHTKLIHLERLPLHARDLLQVLQGPSVITRGDLFWTLRPA